MTALRLMLSLPEDGASGRANRLPALCLPGVTFVPRDEAAAVGMVCIDAMH